MVKDVFLCHNSQEKAEVEKIRKQLLQRGIDAWLDKYDFEPFRPWQEQLEEIIPQVRAVAVFIGPSGVGPWANIEMREFLVEFVNRRLRMGLVILPGCPDELINTVPRFLTGFHWVDFRQQKPDPMNQLVWGITGQRQISNSVILPRSPQQSSNAGFPQNQTTPNNTINPSLIIGGILALVTLAIGINILQKPNPPIAELTPEPTPTETPNPTSTVKPTKRPSSRKKTQPTSKPTPTPTPTPTEEPDSPEEPESTFTPIPDITEITPLTSERGIDYTKLRDLLAEGKWKEADEETYRVMNQALEGNWTENSVLNFPCQDLSTIDLVWRTYSRGHFGFSVQKEIYVSKSFDVESAYNVEARNNLGDIVGWRVNGFWRSKEDVSFDISSPRGHLPHRVWVVGWVEEGRRYGLANYSPIPYLAWKLVRCNI